MNFNIAIRAMRDRLVKVGEWNTRNGIESARISNSDIALLLRYLDETADTVIIDTRPYAVYAIGYHYEGGSGRFIHYTLQQEPLSRVQLTGLEDKLTKSMGGVKKIWIMTINRLANADREEVDSIVPL